VFDPAPLPDVTCLFFDQRHVPEFTARLTDGIRGRHAALDEFFDPFVQVAANLLRQIRFDSPPREQSLDPGHGFTGAGNSDQRLHADMSIHSIYSYRRASIASIRVARRIGT